MPVQPYPYQRDKPNPAIPHQSLATPRQSDTPHMNDTEFFPTPADLATLLVDRLLWKAPTDRFTKNPLMILEPSAGNGAFVHPLARIPGAQVTAIEPFEPEPQDLPENVEWGKMTLEDLHEELRGERPFDLICGNPPFSLAEAHLRLCLQLLNKGGRVGFLLRLGFLASKGRADLFASYPPKHIYVLAARPSFMWSYTCKANKSHKWQVLPGTQQPKCPTCGHTELGCSKTDQYDYCFMLWDTDTPPGTGTTLSHLNLYGDPNA